MTIIDGKALAQQLRLDIRRRVDELRRQHVKTPHLAAILVGDDPASHAYVGGKIKACEEVGFKSTLVKLPDTISQEALHNEIDRLNNDIDIDGFIIQLPLPKHIDVDKVILAVDPNKDVDGFHPVNVGRMVKGLNTFLPATPKGILRMLEAYGIETSGKRCVVIGRSQIVGMPMSILLSQNRRPGNCTVTICHSRTESVEEIVREADIVVAAVGIPGMVKEEMIKEGAVVIDVGINRVDDPQAKRGYRLVGDVDFQSVKDKCSFITPVPGGVGPMTIAGLLLNTLQAVEMRHHHV